VGRGPDQGMRWFCISTISVPSQPLHHRMTFVFFPQGRPSCNNDILRLCFPSQHGQYTSRVSALPVVMGKDLKGFFDMRHGGIVNRR